MAKHEKKKADSDRSARAPAGSPAPGTDEIDFRTVVWSLVILAVLVILHRLIWGG